jgi:hypothetical protein
MVFGHGSIALVNCKRDQRFQATVFGTSSVWRACQSFQRQWEQAPQEVADLEGSVPWTRELRVRLARKRAIHKRQRWQDRQIWWPRAGLVHIRIHFEKSVKSESCTQTHTNSVFFLVIFFAARADSLLLSNFFFFFFAILSIRWTGDHPQQEWAKFSCRPVRELSRCFTESCVILPTNINSFSTYGNCEIYLLKMWRLLRWDRLQVSYFVFVGGCWSFLILQGQRFVRPRIRQPRIWRLSMYVDDPWGCGSTRRQASFGLRMHT